jgi:serine/threonine protein kinase
VHRDIKLENLFLHGSGSSRTVKVGDYGLSKAFDAAGLSGQTLTGETAGTPHFMPRQQLLKYKYAQPDVDVWAIAGCLYYLITGHVPRNFLPDKDPWLTVLTTAPIPIRQRDAAVPARLAELLDAALDDSQGLRFSSAAAFKSALQGVI